MKTNVLLVLLAVICATANAGEPLPIAGDYIEIPATEYSGQQMGRITQVLHGHFIDLSSKQTVIYGKIVDEDEPAYSQNSKFMKFQNGPINDYFNLIDEAIATCQHPKTGLTYIVARIHGGGTIDGEYGYVYFSGVNPKTHKIEVAYSEYAEHGPYDSKICGWPAKVERLSIFSDAMMALRIEDKDYKTKVVEAGDDEFDEYEIVYESIGELESGETMQLPWRSIPAKIAQTWLEKLFNLSADIVLINGEMLPTLVNIDYKHIDDWRIIQVTGTEICSGEYGQGVVLVKHESEKDWRAIYNVEAGCSKLLNYPLYWGEHGIEDDMLPVTMYYEFTHWGDSRDVVIDLRTNVVVAK